NPFEVLRQRHWLVAVSRPTRQGTVGFALSRFDEEDIVRIHLGDVVGIRFGELEDTEGAPKLDPALLFSLREPGELALLFEEAELLHRIADVRHRSAGKPARDCGSTAAATINHLEIVNPVRKRAFTSAVRLFEPIECVNIHPPLPRCPSYRRRRRWPRRPI